MQRRDLCRGELLVQHTCHRDVAGRVSSRISNHACLSTRPHSVCRAHLHAVHVERRCAQVTASRSRHARYDERLPLDGDVVAAVSHVTIPMRIHA